MLPRKVSMSPTRTKTIILDKGLNENVSTIEMKGGELIRGTNYHLTEGSFGGYVSVAGYERFDGRTKPSSISADEDDHTARDAARAAIGEVPGESNVLGVHVFEGDVYAFRNKTGGATTGMYVATASGWSEVDTSASPLVPNGSYEFVNYNFEGHVSTNSMHWVDGKNKARYYNSIDGVVIIDNAGNDPNDTPEHIAIHNYRVFLSYPGGSLQSSGEGDPLEWTLGANEKGLGKEITNLLGGVGNALIVFCDSSITVLHGYALSEWQWETFSLNSGAYTKTAKRLLGTSYFMDDRGVTSLTAAQEFGDFAANSISQKIKNTLEKAKNNITCAAVSRDLNQYRLFLDTNYGLYFSFLDKKLRGITVVRFDTPVYTTAEGEDSSGNNVIYFTSNSGYIYQMDSGTSFDGEAIPTSMQTAYYHYTSPRNWKYFKSITFEIASDSAIDLQIRASYDYASTYLSKGIIKELSLEGSPSLWGEGVWGTMTYGGTGATNRLRHNIKGLGSNMGVTIVTEEAYSLPHTIQNFTTDYELSSRQL